MLLIYATQGYDKQIILEDRTDASVVRRGDQNNIPRVRTLVEEWEVYFIIYFRSSIFGRKFEIYYNQFSYLYERRE